MKYEIKVEEDPLSTDSCKQSEWELIQLVSNIEVFNFDIYKHLKWLHWV